MIIILRQISQITLKFIRADAVFTESLIFDLMIHDNGYTDRMTGGGNGIDPDKIVGYGVKQECYDGR
jgi:hypothetical protein